MDWNKFEQALRGRAKEFQYAQLSIPASATASMSAVGAAALILHGIADAVAAGAAPNAHSEAKDD